MVTSADRTLYLFDDIDAVARLDARAWHGSFNGRESTLHQLSPYVGKMKSGMARVLVSLYSRPGDTVLDPFSGSGVVPFEATLAGRCAIGNDLSPYAYTLTRGKLEAPASEADALERANALVDDVDALTPHVSIDAAPDWVREFYHPDTLREILAAFAVLRGRQDRFI